MSQTEEFKDLKYLNFLTGENSRHSRNSSDSMLQGFYMSLSLLTLYLSLFLFLRHWFPGIYHPKTYLGRRHERNDPPPMNALPFKLIRAMFHTPDHQVIRSCGLDAFFFLRYIQFLFGLFTILAALVIPTLVPLNFVGGKRSNGNGTSDGIFSHKSAKHISSSASTNPSAATNITSPDLTFYLDLISWGNINNEHYNWYWAHFVVAVSLVAIVCYALFNELKYFVQIRQSWLRTHNRQDIHSTATILVAAIPHHRLNVEALRSYFAGFHGGIERVWINRDVRELTKKMKERTRMIKRLEKLETKLVVKANKLAWKNLKFEKPLSAETPTEDVAEGQPAQSEATGKKIALQTQSTWPVLDSPAGNSDSLEQRPISHREPTNSPCEAEFEETIQEQKGEKWRFWFTEKNRTTIRVSPRRSWFFRTFAIPGHKEDAIVLCRREISRLNCEIEAMRKRELPYLNSAFIKFKTRSGAHLALTASHYPGTMRVIAFEPSYNDIIWANIAPGYFSHKVYQFINVVLVAFVILFYCIPASFAAALSQLNSFLHYLDLKRKEEDGHPGVVVKWLMHQTFLRWLTDKNKICFSIQMVCPSLILMLFRLLTSTALYSFAVLQGAPTRAHVELMIQDGLFAFLFMQLFIIGPISATSLRAFALETATEIVKYPDGIFDLSSSFTKKVVYIASHELPNSTIFLLGFLMFQGVCTGGDEIGQVCNGFFEVWHQLRTILGKTRTPRQIFKHQHFVPQCALGITFPLITIYACIVLALCPYQPAVLAFGLLGFGLLWIGFGYSFLYVKRVAGSVAGTNGGLFIKAMKQTFAGIYIMEICLVGLFADVGTHETEDRYGTGNKGCKAVVQGTLMSLVFFATIWWHCYVNRWLKQVGMGLHAFSDQKYEDLDLEELRHERPSAPSQSNQKENVPINGEGKGKEQAKGEESQIVRRLKRESGAGEGEECSCNDAMEDGEDDYLPKALRKQFYTQRAVWIPDDGELVGVGRDEVRLCKAAGVAAVVGGAEVEVGKKRWGEEITVTAIPAILELGFGFAVQAAD